LIRPAIPVAPAINNTGKNRSRLQLQLTPKFQILLQIIPSLNVWRDPSHERNKANNTNAAVVKNGYSPLENNKNMTSSMYLVAVKLGPVNESSKACINSNKQIDWIWLAIGHEFFISNGPYFLFLIISIAVSAEYHIKLSMNGNIDKQIYRDEY
jgi:hypothetical protein